MQNKKGKQLVKCGNLYNVSMPMVFLIYNQGSKLRLVKTCLSQSNLLACLHFVSCVPYVASFFGLPIFDCPFGVFKPLFVTDSLAFQYLFLVVLIVSVN
jgi:hypothetical protein